MAQIAIIRQAQTKASTPSTESIQSGAATGMPVPQGLGSSQASNGLPQRVAGSAGALLSHPAVTSHAVAATRCRRLRSDRQLPPGPSR
jgi:hypothetical protein